MAPRRWPPRSSRRSLRRRPRGNRSALPSSPTPCASTTTLTKTARTAAAPRDPTSARCDRSAQGGQSGREARTEAARRVASQTKIGPCSATLEDLKRIRGIGVLNEKKLNRGLRADRHLALARSQAGNEGRFRSHLWGYLVPCSALRTALAIRAMESCSCLRRARTRASAMR